MNQPRTQSHCPCGGLQSGNQLKALLQKNFRAQKSISFTRPPLLLTPPRIPTGQDATPKEGFRAVMGKKVRSLGKIRVACSP
jgi:hypothetical protein